MVESKPTASRKYEIRGKLKDSSMLVIYEYSSDGSWVARYNAYPMKSGEVPVYTLYPCRGGLTEAGRIRKVNYTKKVINQLDIFAVNTTKVFKS